jgi:endonuclease/exonuclease/phosphatase family metal-dependent hydrolase
VKSFISLQQKRLSDPCHDEIIAQAMPNAQLFKKRCTSAHIEEVRKALIEIKPDILVLQEVSGETPVQEAISILPGFKVAVVSRFKTKGGFIDGQQIAICSRFPAKRVFSEQWAKGWADAPRGFAFAAFDCGGVTVNVYGLHLKSNLGDPPLNTAKYEDAVEQLLKH